jgi:hypothetical protein
LLEKIRCIDVTGISYPVHFHKLFADDQDFSEMQNVPHLGAINCGGPKEMAEVNDAVVCSLCNQLTKVKYRSTYQSHQMGFELACGHRNAWCTKHRCLVMDCSDTGGEVVPMCGHCAHEEAVAEASIPPEYR